ncbi:aspartate kinase [Taibaiella sp. KBW10]|uniref:aspartate kinase n=1 Tax=Taibaiella sp. KBW10 TaxID=2153357 RepID=UPI000F5B0B32|nr:aspartate kinase [Taibaiella sp. KBW10]RQO31621.1 aspartate kinase [Taibaiella sp. KBW10]
MQVYKFGGASIATPERMTALLPIIAEAQKPLLVVVSALGKTTNALEEVVKVAFKGDKQKADDLIKQLEEQHAAYCSALLQGEALDAIQDELHLIFTEMQWAVDTAPQYAYDYVYDQIVSLGELISTSIFSHYLKAQQLSNAWVDARDLVRTNNNYRDALVDEAFTTKQVKDKLLPLFNQYSVVITQGFIGCTDENYSTTLGREGSDYSAALFASMLPASGVTIWKDVEGLLNADPKLFPNTIKIQQISFYEVIEMAYYGAQVIHPKTIKPLHNHNIPLYVKCFLDKGLPGTIIKNEVETAYPPIIVLKKNQILLKITSKDYSFVTEDKLSELYTIFHQHKVKINLLQNAAISLIACVDNNLDKVEPLIAALSQNYQIRRNEDAELLTVRHYDQATFKELIKDRKVLLEQKSRVTVQVVTSNF